MGESPQRVGATEVANIFILAISGLVIAWSSYQATLWANERLTRTSAAGALSAESARLAAQADTVQAVEIGLFGSWLDARVEGDAVRAEAYAARFPPDLRKAFDAWLRLRPEVNPDAPSSPFGLPEYQPQPRAKSDEIKRRAAAAGDRVGEAMQITEDYAKGEGILSFALFFAGVGQVFRERGLRWVLVGLAGLACAFGVWRTLTLPAL